jgi:hypothetical protein
VISILTFKWKSDERFRAQFNSKHVNILYAMLKRNLDQPFRFICITDDNEGLRPEVEYFPLWGSPVPTDRWGPKKPNCFRRLRMYSKEAQAWFGERILMLDLDVVILNKIDSLIDRPEDFVAWTKGGTRYQGAMILHRTGTRTQLWEDFDPKRTPNVIRNEKRVGSDQAWVSMKLPDNEATWTPEDGIYSYKMHVRNKGLPADAKIVLFHGTPKPDQLSDSWVKEHYRE